MRSSFQDFGLARCARKGELVLVRRVLCWLPDPARILPANLPALNFKKPW